MGSLSVEIICSACGKDALLLREAKYDGFVRIGETFLCSVCGHEYADENEVPFKEKDQVHVFTEEDQPAQVHVFSEGENSRLCRYCEQYIVNPFMQWCGHHKREVQATDSCEYFTPKPEPDTGEQNEEET